MALRPNAGHGLLSLEVSRSHSLDAPYSVGLLWTSDQPDAETSTWHHTTLTTDIHAPGGIRTHNLSRRAALDRSATGTCFYVIGLQNCYFYQHSSMWTFSGYVTASIMWSLLQEKYSGRTKSRTRGGRNIHYTLWNWNSVQNFSGYPANEWHGRLAQGGRIKWMFEK